MQKLVIDSNNEGQRLNKYLAKYLDAAPMSFIYKMLRKKNIKLNGSKADGNELLAQDDYIEIYMADETIAKFRKSESLAGESVSKPTISNNSKDNEPLKDIEIIYEDKDILILNKPVGILSQKAKVDDYSLNERIVEYYKQREDIDEMFTPSACNRLDRNTSGIILAGMSYQGTRILSKMLKERTLSKYYLTIVKGNIEKPATIKGFLTKKETHNQVIIYLTKEDANKAGIESPAYIETRYEPLEHGSVDDGRRTYDVTLLKVELITGKTHQIRAHLRSIGHPILGDGKYGHKDINAYMRKELDLKHQLLHAYEIQFPKDVGALSKELSGKEFVAELTEEFSKILHSIIAV
ncbi:MAG: RluA family pseudouridine synthase [Lachnospiraceae bacterium]|nr:RluA family pseudouridine synthase [Lachnospiraceae bacterium]